MSLKSTRHSVASPGLSVTSISSAPALPWSCRTVTAPGLYLLTPCLYISTLSSVQLNQHHPGGPQHQEAGEGAAGSSAFFHVERCVLKDTTETFIFLSTTYLEGEKQFLTTLCHKTHHTPRVLYLCRMSQCVRGLYLVIYVLWHHQYHTIFITMTSFAKARAPILFSFWKSPSFPMLATGFPHLFRTNKVRWNTSWVQWICRSLFGEWIP